MAADTMALVSPQTSSETGEPNQPKHSESADDNGGSEARSFNSTRQGSSVESSSSLLTQTKPLLNDWKVTTAEKPHSQIFTTEPPRRSRQGFEWLWLREGCWIEREKIEQVQQQKGKKSLIRRKSMPVKRKYDSSSLFSSGEAAGSSPAQEFNPLQAFNVAQPDNGSVHESPARPWGGSSGTETAQNSHKLLKRFQHISPTCPHFKSPTGEPEGLYCKTKCRIETGILGKHKEGVCGHVLSSEQDIPSRATATIEGATTSLNHFHPERQNHHPLDALAGVRAQSMGSTGPRRRIGLAPSHRRNSQDSVWSVTSSIQEVLMGRTPLATPSPEMQYGGQNGKKYAKVEISSSNDPTFLQSEAQRVDTPPTSSDPPTGHGRGFVFDLSPSSNDAQSQLDSDIQHLTSSAISRDLTETHSDSLGKCESWDVEKPIATKRKMEPPQFELDVPAHLPGSPLCPLHAEHKSCGTGICVYHGRKGNQKI